MSQQAVDQAYNAAGLKGALGRKCKRSMRLYVQFRRTHQEIADAVGVSRPTIQKWSRIYKWDEVRKLYEGIIGQHIRIVDKLAKKVEKKGEKKDASEADVRNYLKAYDMMMKTDPMMQPLANEKIVEVTTGLLERFKKYNPRVYEGFIKSEYYTDFMEEMIEG